MSVLPVIRLKLHRSVRSVLTCTDRVLRHLSQKCVQKGETIGAGDVVLLAGNMPSDLWRLYSPLMLLSCWRLWPKDELGKLCSAATSRQSESFRNFSCNLPAQTFLSGNVLQYGCCSKTHRLVYIDLLQDNIAHQFGCSDIAASLSGLPQGQRESHNSCLSFECSSCTMLHATVCTKDGSELCNACATSLRTEC